MRQPFDMFNRNLYFFVYCTTNIKKNGKSHITDLVFSMNEKADMDDGILYVLFRQDILRRVCHIRTSRSINIGLICF